MNKNLQFYLYDNYFRKTTFILLFTLIYLPAFSQNELYLNGINQFYNNGCLLYVNGDINNNDGLFVNTVNGIYTGKLSSLPEIGRTRFLLIPTHPPVLNVLVETTIS